MPFQPAENVVQCELRYTWQGQQVENVLHYIMDPITPQAMADLAAEVYSVWATYCAPITSNTVTLREVYVFDLTTADGGTATFAPSPLATGGNVNESVVNSTTLCLSLRTALRGRSRRGRLYIVGLTDNIVADNRVSAGGAQAFLDAYANFFDPGVITAGDWAVLSRFSDGVARPVASAATITQVLFTDTVVDTQRRRLPGRGT